MGILLFSVWQAWVNRVFLFGRIHYLSSIAILAQGVTLSKMVRFHFSHPPPTLVCLPVAFYGERLVSAVEGRCFSTPFDPRGGVGDLINLRGHLRSLVTMGLIHTHPNALCVESHRS